MLRILSFKKSDWLANIRGDILAGTVVALALIPEAIAFAIIAGVDPKVGLYTSFSIAVVSAIFGGRPGMISAATGAMALLMVNLVKNHGLEYLFAATVLTGLIQMVMAWLTLDKLMSFISRSVMTGFVNALAILIFMAQMPELTTYGNWQVYLITASGLAIIYLFPLIPKIGKILPSPLVSILLMTAIVVSLGIDIRTVGDMGQLPDTLPIWHFPDVPLNLETLLIILPYAGALAVVGLLESLMTATIVDEMTDTKSDKNRECQSQGIANLITGFMGGMAGCAMIGQSVINIKSGGRGRLSTLVAGLILLTLVVFLDDLVSLIPMASLVAVMIMVSIGTFDWQSIINLRKNPPSSSIVTVATVLVVVLTHNLAYGALIGVLLASLFFANKIGHFMYTESHLDEKNIRSYKIHGQVFFNSAGKFLDQFNFEEQVPKIVIDLSGAHFWDITAVHSLDRAVIKFKKAGKAVEIKGLNEASETIIDRFGIVDKPEEIDKILSRH